MPEFIPGLRLSDRFYHEAVKPILDAFYPGLPHTAALIGSGSEVLGFDTPMSADHHWGPRVLLFVSDPEHSLYADPIHDTLRHQLPRSFYGYSTNFSEPDPNDNGTQLLRAIESGPVNHRVEITTIRDFFRNETNLDPYDEIKVADWLTIPSQKLRTMTAGAVYHDDLGLNAIREKLTWYPHDVWLYLLAAGWTRIGQEEAFIGRTGYVGDELGSQVIAARLVRDVMRLCFLIERQYPPYSKWYGTAFSKLDCAATMTPILQQVMLQSTWQEREQFLCEAYEMLARMHNALGITEPLPAKASPYFGRPFMVIHGDQFAEAIRTSITDERVNRMSTHVGSIDQFSDSTDLLENSALRQRLKALYED